VKFDRIRSCGNLLPKQRLLAVNCCDRRSLQTMSKICAKCEKPVYPTEELKCLDKVSS